MSDLPICDCGTYWPGEGHHPECPVRREIERLRAEIKRLLVRLGEIAVQAQEELAAKRQRARLPEDLVARCKEMLDTCWGATPGKEQAPMERLFRDILAAVERSRD